MRTETFTVSGSGGIALPCTVWLPEYKVRAVVQVTHGMTEHMGRYTRLAQVLTTCGIAVVGFDLRGHGRNGGDPKCASFGEGGWDATLEDMHLVRGYINQRFAVPYFMLGFSLGSFLQRDYFAKYGTDGVSGAIILGTGHQPSAVLTPLMQIVKGQIDKCGFDGTTRMVQKLSFDTYNSKIVFRRTRADWLCTDDLQLDDYLADPLCREGISAGLFYQLLDAMKRTGSEGAYDRWSKELPILLVSGIEDPVGDYGKGVEQVDAAMAQAGLTRVETKLLPITRHDILHEEHSGTAARLRTMIVSFVCKYM